MKLIICLLYWEFMDHTDQFREWLSITYPELLARGLGANLLHVISGRHTKSNSGKVHWHINMIVEYTDENARKYKDFSSKFRRLKINVPKEYDDMFPEKYNIKYYYDDQKDYDENCMGYPLKEYVHITNVPMMLQYGYTEDEIERLRKIAHTIWNRKYQEIQKKKAEEITLKEYLDKNLNFDNDQTAYNPALSKIRKVIRQIIFYRKIQFNRGETKSIQLTRLKDQAVSYLYFNGYITEQDILEELRI